MKLSVKNLVQRQIFAKLILTAYMLQGVASLIYQVSWEQATEKIVGMALPTMSMIVGLFFLGMAGGACIGGNKAIKSKEASLLFVLAQFLLGAFAYFFGASNGFEFICLLVTKNESLLSLTYSLRLLLLALILFLPSFLLGLGFPLLYKIGAASINQGRAQRLYFINIIGSIFGALLAGFWLLPNFGTSKSVCFAACFNLLSALPFCIYQGQRQEISDEVEWQSTRVTNNRNFSKALALSVIIISAAGFFGLCLELLFVRVLVLIMNSTGLAFSIACAVQVAAIGCSAFAVIYFLPKDGGNFHRQAAVLFFTAAAWLILVIFSFSGLFELKTFLNQAFSFCKAGPSVSLLSGIIIAIVFILPPAFCLGAILPLYFKCREKLWQQFQMSTSRAYALNLFACLFGSIMAGVLIMPCLYILSCYAVQLAFLICALMLLGLAALVASYQMSKQQFFYLVIGSLLLFVFLPLSWYKLKSPLVENTNGLMYYREGLNSTVCLFKNTEKNILYLQNDGLTEATLPLSNKYPSQWSDISTQSLLGILPNLCLSTGNKREFLLGLGAGTTAGAILDDEKVANLDVAELEPAVVQAASLMCLSDKNDRMKIRIIDGRTWLSALDKPYDVIIAQAGEPWRSASRYLYTFEFWRLVEKRLQKKGIFCQWVPLYAIDQKNLLSLCQTFKKVFPMTYVVRPYRSGEIILLAFKDDSLRPKSQNRHMVSLAECIGKNLFEDKKIKERLDKIGITSQPDLLALFRMGPNELGQLLQHAYPVVTDDYPYVQYRLQSLVNKKGISINKDVSALVSENLSIFENVVSKPR